MEFVNSKGKILLVDDEDDLRLLLAKRLIHEGYEVIEAENGSVAIDKIKDEKPDLVLLDIMMPQMTGHQVWSQLRSNPVLKKMPVIILSAKPRATNVFFGQEISAFDYIDKPYEVELLLKRIAQKIRDTKDKK